MSRATVARSSTLGAARARMESCAPIAMRGRVSSLRGLALFVDDLPVGIGALVSVRTSAGVRRGEVVAFEGQRAVVLLYDHTTGVRASDPVLLEQPAPVFSVGTSLLGRTVNALGEPLDGHGRACETVPAALHTPPTNAMRRAVINEPLLTGVPALDLLTTVGKGQRLGLFAGPGVGKSTLLADIARGSSSDATVIALVGERGREVREFIEHTLGPEGLARSCLIVATGDESPLLRVRAALSACAMAEHLARRSMDVTLIIDSVTRLAHAQRQIGLAAGEPPATKGFTPSVFALLPSILERAGNIDGAGSVTAFYSVLVEGDDMTEPIADAVRGVLDGHVILSRTLAQKGHFPAIDPLDSISRLASAITTPEHAECRRLVLGLLAAYAEAEELIRLGAYARGSDRKIDAAIELKPEIDALLTQARGERRPFEECVAMLQSIAVRAAQLLEGGPNQQRRQPQPRRAG